MTEDQKHRIVEAGLFCEAELIQAEWRRASGFFEVAEEHEAAAALWSEVAFREAQA